jgi:RNA polymerase sigma-70 factor (ECF subfamily)
MIDAFADVLVAAQTGDPAALTVLYRALNPGVERYLRGRAPDAAEDLASDTWIAVAAALPRFEGDEGDFRGWVYTIARNRVIDAHRRAQRRPEETRPVGLNDDPEGADLDSMYGTDRGAVAPAESSVIDALDDEAVVALVRRLPPDQADVIMLRVIGGLDTERVATVLGKRAGTVRVLQHRGLRNLERLLGDRPRGMDDEA